MRTQSADKTLTTGKFINKFKGTDLLVDIQSTERNLANRPTENIPDVK